MENNNYKLEKLEAISIILIIMINKLILNIPYYIVDLVGSGAIVNLIYIGIIDFIFLLIILKLLNKFENFDIIDISEFLGGKFLKYFVGIISIALFLLISFITLIDFSNVLHTIYFSNFPMIYILFFFIIGTLIANLIGIRGISRTISFILPFAILSVVITFITAFENLDIKDLTPILGQNLNTTFVKGLSNCFAMYIIVCFYFFGPLLKETRKEKTNFYYIIYNFIYFVIAYNYSNAYFI